MVCLSTIAAALLLGVSSVLGAPAKDPILDSRQSTDKLVFCHFMIGITGDRTSAADYDADMQRAKGLGIDAFALNIGVDWYTDQQLGYAYQSAANNGMKVFISFDFNWYNTGQASDVGAKIASYASQPAQLYVDNKVFASSFAGDGLNIAALRSAVGRDLFFAPNFHPSYGTDFSTIDGALNWMAWDNNGNNKAPDAGHNVTVAQGDADYVKALNGKPYIAPVSAWFSTHFGPEVPYSKNWVFPGDLLWYNRWNEILALKPRFLEIITWNDYGESHYIGPLNSPHYDDGNSKWVNDMPHDGWLDMAKPFISAFKAGASSANSYVASDQLVYWYRPNPRALNCDSTDTTMVSASNSSGNYFMGRPNGWESMTDSVFVVALLQQAGTVTVMSGNNVQTFNAPAGISSFQVDMQVGKQQFFLVRNGQTVLSAVSLKDVTNTCICGIYNFNAYVGTVPDGPVDQLQRDGINSLTIGLHVSTCQATPSLPTSTIKPTTTPPGGGGSGPTSTTTTPKPTSTPTSTTSKPTTTATTTTTTTKTTTTTTTTTTTSSGHCVSGTVAPGMSGNYIGLCDFCCHYDYCPPGPCVCTAFGAPVPTPPVTGEVGLPADGEDDSYLGLCSFACNHGYCPPTACKQG